MRVALLGAGTVGGAVAKVLAAEHEAWGITLAGIAVRDLAKARAAGLDRLAPLTTDPAGLAAAPDVDLVVELMGGLDPALAIVEGALTSGRPVVTANKLLLATFGTRLEALARASGSFMVVSSTTNVERFERGLHATKLIRARSTFSCHPRSAPKASTTSSATRWSTTTFRGRSEEHTSELQSH